MATARQQQLGVDFFADIETGPTNPTALKRTFGKSGPIRVKLYRCVAYRGGAVHACTFESVLKPFVGRIYACTSESVLKPFVGWWDHASWCLHWHKLFSSVPKPAGTLRSVVTWFFANTLTPPLPLLYPHPLSPNSNPPTLQ